MANAMEGIMGLPNSAPAGGQNVASMVDMQALEQASAEANRDPMTFREGVLQGMQESDPQMVAEFKRAISSMQLPDDVIQALGAVVDEIMRTPQEYPAIREEMLMDDDEGIFADLLPETFDMAYFMALDMALDQLAMNVAQAPQAFANGGLATLNPIAQAMAQMGRNGDTMLAHITPAEARMLRARGGSGTINPVTGLPEFFFKSVFRAAKKVVKGAAKVVKKTVSAVKSVVKKVASSTIGKIALTIGATMLLGPGSFGLIEGGLAGGLLGVSTPALAFGINTAAASTLVGVAGGQKFGDALKGGIVSGVMAGGMATAFPSTLPSSYTTPAAGATTALPGVEDLTVKSAGAGGTDAMAAGTGLTTPSSVLSEAGTAGVSVDPMTGAVTSPVTTGYPISGSQYSLGAPGSAPFSTAPTNLFPPAEMSVAGTPLPSSIAPISTPTTSLGGGLSAMESPLMSLQSATPTPDYLGGAQFSSQMAPTTGGITGLPTTVAGTPYTSPSFVNGIPVENATQPFVNTGTTSAQPSFFQKTVDFFSPSARQAAGQADQLAAYNDTLLKTGGTMLSDGTIQGGNVALATEAYKAAAPGFISTYGPIAGLGVGAAAAMGAFTPPEEPSPEDLGEEFAGPSGTELLEQQPEKYGVTIGPTEAQYIDVGNTLYNPVGYAPQQQRMYDFRNAIAYKPGYAPSRPYYAMGYADGGIAALADGGTAQYPRKNGHISGPGGPKDDKIPAMLSDGEFVFTAKAVRNMGNGSRRKGAKKMYALMKQLENGGAA
jgi:hypothetical protein